MLEPSNLGVFLSNDCCLPSIRPFAMPFSRLKLKLSAPSKSTNLVPRTLESSRCAHVLDFAQVQPTTANLNCKVNFLKSVPTLRFDSSKGQLICKRMHLSLEEVSHVSGCLEQGLGVNHSDVETEIEDTALNSWSNSDESFVVDDQQDAEREIGLKTKKIVPWNKGKKHNAETRERISYRTKEALRDPKVRMKMSNHPRPPLSKRTRAKIGASQARLWDKRLKWKRSRENFFILWCNSIAKAAKRGGIDQDKLKWDSYGKMKREIVLEQLQLAADRAEAKIMKQLLAQERAEEKARAEMEKLEQKRKDDAERAKSGNSTRKHKSKKEIEELAAGGLKKLKERLTKIHKKKSRGGQVVRQDQKAWDSLDLESLEKKRNEVSLADQIQAIRSKCAKSVRSETPMASYSVDLAN